jgi:hypothetical protein
VEVRAREGDAMRRYAGWVVGAVAIVAAGVSLATRTRGTTPEPAPPAGRPAKAVARLDLTKPFPKATPAPAAVATTKAVPVALELSRPFPKAGGGAPVRQARWVGSKAPAVPLDLTTPFPKAVTLAPHIPAAAP